MITSKDLQGWSLISQLSNLCVFCMYVVTEGTSIQHHAMASCEFAERCFPGAKKCVRYVPKDLDE